VSGCSPLIYGGAGYSGRLIVQRAVERGLRPIVAGRDPRAIAAVAAPFGLEWRVARVDDPAALREMLKSVSVTVNAAGPFSSTADPMIQACLDTGSHYLDITGEATTIEATRKWHRAAFEKGVMLMPAAGFDVVASDCLAARVARRLPAATLLRVGFDKSDAMSIGSLKTTLEMGGKGVLVRRGGKLGRVTPGSLTHHFDYGNGPQISCAVNLGDVSSAFYSTGISNIEAYMRATPQVWGATSANRYWGSLLGMPSWQAFMKAQSRRFSSDPTPEERNRGWGVLVAEASESQGGCERSRMRTCDVYWYTALSVVGVVEKVLGGNFDPGFKTPSLVYGPDFAFSFGGASLEDL